MVYIFHVHRANNYPVATFSNLDDAVYLCSKRHYYVKHQIWRNTGDETDFDDFFITKRSHDTFPMQSEIVEYDILPEESFTEAIEKSLTEKNRILDRARSAEQSLLSIEKIFSEQRGPHWKATMDDKEIDVLILLEDAMYEEAMFEPWLPSSGKKQKNLPFSFKKLRMFARNLSRTFETKQRHELKRSKSVDSIISVKSYMTV